MTHPKRPPELLKGDALLCGPASGGTLAAASSARVATRYDKIARNFLAAVLLAATRLRGSFASVA
jgi:hypothetical protein